jgi:hypothetical protein
LLHAAAADELLHDFPSPRLIDCGIDRQKDPNVGDIYIGDHCYMDADVSEGSIPPAAGCTYNISKEAEDIGDITSEMAIRNADVPLPESPVPAEYIYDIPEEAQGIECLCPRPLPGYTPWDSLPSKPSAQLDD